MKNIVYIIVGWSYLWIRYRDKEKVKHILYEEYEGSYHFVGAELILSLFGVILFILLVLFLIMIIGRIIYDLMN